jgi:GNAT superfamily N-acetyltransferase
MRTAPSFPTDHLPTVDVRPAVGRFDDFAVVVGPRRPGVHGCWCMAYRDSRVPNEERPDYLRAECATEPGPGVLVYVDDIVAGWCSVAPRASYRRLLHSRTIPAPPQEHTWAAVCFVVRAGYRRHGLMNQLLAGAVEHASAGGAQAIEGYPVDASGGPVDVISGYVGTVALFERAGFRRVAPTAGRSGGLPRWVLRRTLS